MYIMCIYSCLICISNVSLLEILDTSLVEKRYFVVRRKIYLDSTCLYTQIKYYNNIIDKFC